MELIQRTAAAFFSMLRRFSDFSSRTPRREYWLAAGVTAGLLIVLLLPALLIPIAGPVLLILAAVTLAVPFLAVTARRLHDVSRSAWWLLAGIVPVLGLAVLIFFTVRQGDDGDNLYGASPEPIEHF